MESQNESVSENGSQRERLYESAQNLLSAMYVLANRHGEMKQDELELYEDMTEFCGSLVGRAFFNSFPNQKQVSVLEHSMEIMEWLLLSAFDSPTELPDGLKSQIPTLKQMAETLFSPIEAERFKQEMDMAMSDRTTFKRCLFKIHKATYEHEREGGKFSLSYCEYCFANKLAPALLPEIQERFSSRFVCLQFARALESLSMSPGIPQSKIESLLSVVENFRKFAGIDKERVSNYESILHHMSQAFACAKVETTVLVRQGVLSAEDVARALNLDENEIIELSKSEGVQKYIDSVID